MACCTRPFTESLAEADRDDLLCLHRGVSDRVDLYSNLRSINADDHNSAYEIGCATTIGTGHWDNACQNAIQLVAASNKISHRPSTHVTTALSARGTGQVSGQRAQEILRARTKLSIHYNFRNMHNAKPNSLSTKSTAAAGSSMHRRLAHDSGR